MNNPLNPTCYEIKATVSKGLAVFATRPIQLGTRITSEAPLLTAIREPGTIDPLTIYETFEKLTPSQQEIYLQLYPSPKQTEYALQCMDDDLPSDIRDFVAKVSSIFESNAFRMGSSSRQTAEEEYLAGIFPTAARFNHSCCPNVAQTWSRKMGVLTMHAIRNIEAGEELYEGYVPLTGDCSARQNGLSAYGFVCDCGACAGGEERRIREERRERIRRLEDFLEEFTRQMEGKAQKKSGKPDKSKIIGQDDALRAVSELESLLKEEGLVGHDLLRWYDYAAWNSATHHSDDLTSVINWQKKAFMLDLQIKGGDHEDTDKAKQRLTELTRKSIKSMT